MFISKNQSEFFNTIPSSVAAIGDFDGFHLGHKSLLQETVKKANELSLPASVIIFDQHPAEMHLSNSPKLLYPIEKELEFINNFGISSVLIVPIARESADSSFLEFVQNCLCNQKKISALFMSKDFNLGIDLTEYKEIVNKINIPIFHVDSIRKDGISVSSAQILHLLEEGNVTMAESYLGHSFSIQGEIILGKRRGGAVFGFPTINLAYPSRMALPCQGLYSSAVRFLDGKYAGEFFSSLTNIPSSSTELVKIETHILDFSDDVYGCSVEIFFLERLRNERKFGSDPDDQRGKAIIQRRSLRKLPLLP